MNGRRHGADAGSVDPAPLMALATAYWGSRSLHVAIEAGVFAALARGPATPDVLAQRLGLASRPMALLLNALEGLSLLRRDGECHALTPLSATFLDPDSPAYLGEALAYASDMYPAWEQLRGALRDDAPVVANAEYLEEGERTRRFVRSMHARAMGVGRALASLVDLSDCQSLLDLGGGPGTYSGLLVQGNPGLRATVVELPGVASVAEEILIEMGVEDRVSLRSGDIHVTELPTRQDAVLISGVLHREAPARAAALVRRAANCLRPGGQLVVSDVFTDEGGATPAFAALFGLNMLLSAPDGGVHSDAEVATWMREAGIVDPRIRPFPPPMPHRIVHGLMGNS